jgi:hypothetical protein
VRLSAIRVLNDKFGGNRGEKPAGSGTPLTPAACHQVFSHLVEKILQAFPPFMEGGRCWKLVRNVVKKFGKNCPRSPSTKNVALAPRSALASLPQEQGTPAVSLAKMPSKNIWPDIQGRSKMSGSSLKNTEKSLPSNSTIARSGRDAATPNFSQI